jgi:hypothetical protein
MVPDSLPEVITLLPKYATPRRGFRKARSIGNEFAMHAFKKQLRSAGKTRQVMEERYARGVGFGNRGQNNKIQWRSLNNIPHYSRGFTNYVPPRERALLKTVPGDGRPKNLRSSLKGMRTLHNIIQLFAPHHNQLIFDPFAGTMSTVVAAVAKRRPVLALERDKTCFELGRSRVYEICYLQTANQIMAARIPDAQRTCLCRRSPGPQAVDAHPVEEDDWENEDLEDELMEIEASADDEVLEQADTRVAATKGGPVVDH